MKKITNGVTVSMVILFLLVFYCNNTKPGRDDEEIKVTDINFPYELIVVPGKSAVKKLLELRNLNVRNYTPIIIGDKNDLDRVKENHDAFKESCEDFLKKAKMLDLEKFFEDVENQEIEYYKNVPLGVWPKKSIPKMSLTAHTDILSGKPKKTVYIAKIPTKNTYEVPGYLKIGAWNDCPGPEVHIAIQKYWYKKYRAEMVTFTGDVIEFLVAKPPLNKDEAMKLAREQFLYCTDIVYQGLETLSNLGATIIGSDTWYFWWD